MSHHHHHHHHDAGIHPVPDAPRWDAVYTEAEQVWSGEPNQALVTEVSGMPPGRVVDVGCGEGADAVWLASRGWRVTALDPSGVALDRARSAAAAAGVEVEWAHAGLAEAGQDVLPDNGFDLVLSFYAALDLSAGPVERLARLAAPGGTLLVVHHADVDPERARERGFDPDLLMSPDDVAAGLFDGWDVQVHERCERRVSAGAGVEHTADLVVRALRT